MLGVHEHGHEPSRAQPRPSPPTRRDPPRPLGRRAQSKDGQGCGGGRSAAPTSLQAPKVVTPLWIMGVVPAATLPQLCMGMGTFVAALLTVAAFLWDYTMTGQLLLVLLGCTCCCVWPLCYSYANQVLVMDWTLLPDEEPPAVEES